MTNLLDLDYEHLVSYIETFGEKPYRAKQLMHWIYQENIINFNEYLVDGREINLSSGIKFNFSKEVYVAAVYESNKNNFSAENPYKYNQILLYYIMKF